MTTYNKIEIDGTTYIDLSQDTVASAADIVAGKVGHLNDGTQVTGTATQSGGLTTVASGTFTAAGEAGGTSAGTLFFVGKKMPRTDFWFKFKAKSNTEFVYNNTYKWAYGMAVVFSDIGHFDLSSVADSKQMISDISYNINNSGTVTLTAAGAPVISMDYVRNATAKNPMYANNLRVDRRSDGFYIRLYHSNASYLFPSGVKYDWELVYFGTNSTTDIVEIP